MVYTPRTLEGCGWDSASPAILCHADTGRGVGRKDCMKASGGSGSNPGVCGGRWSLDGGRAVWRQENWFWRHLGSAVGRTPCLHSCGGGEEGRVEQKLGFCPEQ